ncbi:26416_t:CDS:2, partial [Gigaspora margarita]
DELEDEIMSNEKKNKQNSNSYRRRVLKYKAKNKSRRDKSKKKHIDVLSDKDEIILDASLPSANEDEISNISIPADQNDYPRVIIYQVGFPCANSYIQIEDEILNEDISDNDKVDDNVSSSNDLTDSIVNPRANNFQASTTPHESTASLSIN